MNRDKAKEVIKALESDGTLGMFPYHIAGSFRRGKEEGLHDVDIVVVNDFRDGNKETIRVLEEQVDLFYCSVDTFAPAYMTWTGSMKFNIMCRGKAKKMGLKFSQYGIFKKDTDDRVDDNTEEGIIKLLNVDPIYEVPCARSNV
ncbi:MAG: hypothetical protein CBC83_00615 [Flavobacteriales bacterium TMED123]|nr:MAG: hypothetical protein CBC83_00615 [Flavobacteriales bacterium TMED123]|tara:strand:- start:299 stop:730 length:432 start_codon:yes stop_codon:yes gene_type:complete